MPGRPMRRQKKLAYGEKERGMDILLPQKLYGVIGWPLGQSLSPLLHNTGFQSMGIPAIYMAWPVEPGQLDIFMDSLPILKIQGLSVTIPHKLKVMERLDNMSEAAALAGAVNTLFWRDGDLCGENTDVAGFLAPLSSMRLDNMSVLLLGAGGAAHAVGAALRLSGCRNARIASPGNKNQYPLAERFGFTAIAWEDRYSMPAALVINATPLGMHGDLPGQTPYDFSEAPPMANGYAYDLVYNPLQTRFLAEAAKAGRQTISGLEMFFGQGNAQFKLWTGQDLPPCARTALEKALGAN